MKKTLYGIMLILAFISGYWSHKSETIIKEIPKEVIPIDKQCYDKPLELNKICANYLDLEVKTEKLNEKLNEWISGYKEGYKNK